MGGLDRRRRLEQGAVVLQLRLALRGYGLVGDVKYTCVLEQLEHRVQL